MWWSALSRPAEDAAKQKHDKSRSRAFGAPKLDAMQWAALAIAGGVLIGIGKLLKNAARSAAVSCSVSACIVCVFCSEHEVNVV